MQWPVQWPLMKVHADAKKAEKAVERDESPRTHAEDDASSAAHDGLAFVSASGVVHPAHTRGVRGTFYGSFRPAAVHQKGAVHSAPAMERMAFSAVSADHLHASAVADDAFCKLDE